MDKNLVDLMQTFKTLKIQIVLKCGVSSVLNNCLHFVQTESCEGKKTQKTDRGCFCRILTGFELQHRKHSSPTDQLFSPCQSIDSAGRGLGAQRRSSEETPQSSDGVQRPAAVEAGEELPETEVPERSRPYGAGRLTAAQRHPGQDLVPEQEVRDARGGNLLSGDDGTELEVAREEKV